MDEDIDDLLQEVEEKFIMRMHDSSVGKKDKLSSSDSSYRDTSDLDDIIPDVDAEKETFFYSSSSSSSVKKKCFPAYLGGVDYSVGLSALSERRVCDNLHCTSCDFSVYYFDNFKWSDSTDYLFLRTNMPKFEKVKCNLISAHGWRAYACQCTHFSTDSLQQVNSTLPFSWICRGH